MGGEAEVLVETEADVVAVEAVGGEGVWGGEEGVLEGTGDGGFSGGGEAGEPDCETFLPAQEGAVGVGEGGVGGYVGGHINGGMGGREDEWEGEVVGREACVCAWCVWRD